MPNTLSASIPEPPRFLSEEAYHALFAKIRGLASPEGQTRAGLHSAWRSDVRWARNRMTLAGEWRNIDVGVTRSGDETASGFAYTNQQDLESLRGAVHWAESMWEVFLNRRVAPGAPAEHQSRQRYPATHIWSDATYTQTQDARIDLANHLIVDAEASGMLSAGYLAIEAHGHVLELPDQRLVYAPLTEAQCSMTVRDPAGQGSGWAGLSSYDWGRIDAPKLAAIALHKCLASRNPVRIEPGRYTLILEPQATFDLMQPLLRSLERFMDLDANLGQPTWPFHGTKTSKVRVSAYGSDQVLQSTRVGERVFDPRLHLRFDPLDPDLGVVPFDEHGYPVQPVQWVTSGVLAELSYPSNMNALDMASLGVQLDLQGRSNRGAFRLESAAAPTSLEEMITTTERGLLVTRLWGVQLVDPSSVLLTGSTRDGLWLIEHGRITHPVKNLRFTESPIFALNQVEQIGATVPVFSPGIPAMTPAMKVRDFSFTALSDAI